MAITRLAHWARSNKFPNASIAAADKLLDRAHGKPAQAVTGPDNGPIKVETDELTLARTIAFLLSKAANSQT
jgi:hypothetical protein